MIISTFIGSIVGSIVTITLYPCAKKLKYRRDMKKFIAGKLKIIKMIYLTLLWKLLQYQLQKENKSPKNTH